MTEKSSQMGVRKFPVEAFDDWLDCVDPELIRLGDFAPAMYILMRIFKGMAPQTSSVTAADLEGKSSLAGLHLGVTDKGTPLVMYEYELGSHILQRNPTSGESFTHPVELACMVTTMISCDIGMEMEAVPEGDREMMYEVYHRLYEEGMDIAQRISEQTARNHYHFIN